MTVPCKVSPAEMREAFRLNLTSAFWWKAALGNTRALIYLVLLIFLIGAKLTGQSSIEWQGVIIISGLVVLFFCLYLFRLHRTILKNTKALNETCNSLEIDAQGITAESANGARAFTPWSAVTRWREGKLVFTIGDAKTFRTVPKGILGEVQSGQLRSLLLSQIPQQPN